MRARPHHSGSKEPILQILGQLGLTQSLTQAIPLTMTNVTTLQPYTSADGMTASALTIS